MYGILKSEATPCLCCFRCSSAASATQPSYTFITAGNECRISLHALRTNALLGWSLRTQWLQDGLLAAFENVQHLPFLQITRVPQQRQANLLRPGALDIEDFHVACALVSQRLDEEAGVEKSGVALRFRQGAGSLDPDFKLLVRLLNQECVIWLLDACLDLEASGAKHKLAEASD